MRGMSIVGETGKRGRSRGGGQGHTHKGEGKGRFRGAANTIGKQEWRVGEIIRL